MNYVIYVYTTLFWRYLIAIYFYYIFYKYAYYIGNLQENKNHQKNYCESIGTIAM